MEERFAVKRDSADEEETRVKSLEDEDLKKKRGGFVFLGPHSKVLV